MSALKNWDLWLISVAGGQPEMIGLNWSWGIHRLSISPDGRRLTFAGIGGASMDSDK
jgi:hypothetical protein